MINFSTLLSTCLVGFTTAATINYGNQVFFQNEHYSNRWLSGARNRGNGGVITRNYYRSSYERDQVARTYKWIIRSTPGNGERTFRDPKRGDCVKYGETVYLQNNWMNHRWLSGSRDRGNEKTLTRNHLRSNYERNTAKKTYQWIIRSNAGSGALTQTNNGDPAFGQCVQEVQKIYLQNKWMASRWLSGARGRGNGGVITRNLRKNSYESSNAKNTYKWTVRKTPRTICDPNNQGSIPGQNENSALSKVFRALNLARCHHGLPRFDWHRNVAEQMGNSCNRDSAFDGQGHMIAPGFDWARNFASQIDARGVGQWYNERSAFENQGAWFGTSPPAGHFLSIALPHMVEVACAICPSGRHEGLYCNMRYNPVPMSGCGPGCIGVGDRPDYQHTVTRPSISESAVIDQINNIA